MTEAENPYTPPEASLDREKVPVQPLPVVREALSQVQSEAGELDRKELIERIEQVLEENGKEDMVKMAVLSMQVFKKRGYVLNDDLTMEFKPKKGKVVKVVFAIHKEDEDQNDPDRYTGRIIR